MTEVRTLSTNEYRCEMCGGVFEKGWSDEEALAEQKENGYQDMDCGVVCDDCYKTIFAEFT